ncbi:sensor histidine kinase [Nocardioides sp.]|jgi:signal transduction histidine kinase|uniref:sensor histidine kinase n=1 Tax=Nocardioides sp. TaxID=35761 RepID=UPI002F409419
MTRSDLVLGLRRVALDWLAPTVVLVIGIVNISQQSRSAAYPGPPGRHLAFLVVAVAGLGLRRRAPLLAPLLTIAVVTWWTTLWPVGTQGPFEGFVLMVGAAYCLGSLRDARKLTIGAGALAAWFVIGLFVDLVGGRAGDLAPIAVWLTVGFGVGYLISRRTEQARQAREATRVLAAEQERQTARAVEDERARIARELHDVVAHGLSVIVVQAGAERRSLHGPNLDEESIDSTLGSIERAGREALVDLRRLLGLLRRTDEPVALSPQPGLAQLDDLLSSVREAGLQVDVDISGDRSQLPPGLDLTAYRIVQEALTNVLKHANAQCVRVGVAFQRTHLDLEVSDDGSSGPRNRFAIAGPGHGLIGMRERVNVFGGTISAGTSTGGGWTVHARLPVTAVGVG